MIRKSIYIFAIFFCLINFIACKEEEVFNPTTESESSAAVEFIFNIITGGTTRSIEGSKSTFVDGDVIHLSGHFTDASGEKIDVYGCMRMENGKFRPVNGSPLVWPDLAIEGSFEAFYINNSSGIIEEGEQTTTFELSKLKIETDPLYATTDRSVSWGHTVELNFTHALTYLQLVNLDLGISDSFKFYKNGLNNVFFLKRSGGNLSLEFDQLPNPDNDEVYISRPVSNINEGGEVSAQVSFFLQPGDYSYFQLLTQYDDPYLLYDNSISENLIANTPYLIDVKKSQGIIITEPGEEDWVEPGDCWDIDVNDFLSAIVNGEDYYNDENQHILSKTQNGTKLLHNVDFNFYQDYNKLDEEPTIPSGIVFDGGHHYIQNVGYPIFRYNYGTIQNLGVKTVRANVTSEEHNEEKESIKDMSRQGVICCFNQSGGTIQNLRLSDVIFTVSVSSTDSQESHNIGSIAGSNTGSILDSYVYENISINIENKSDDVSASVYMGGIVGQNAGIISGISELDEEHPLNTLKVTNKCRGKTGTFYLGGVSGVNSKVIDQVVLPNLTVDSGESMGAICYVGGIAGRLDSEASTDVAIVQSSTVAGILYGGNCQKIGTDTEAVSYVGGLAGGVYNVSVVDCRSTCNVEGISTNINNQVIYFTGGAFGRIFTSFQNIRNIVAWGTTLSGAGEYIGNFAGAIPMNQDYDENYRPNNMLIREIVTKMVGGNY